MPTLLIIGQCRFFFFSNEGKEPAHVHVECGNGLSRYFYIRHRIDMKKVLIYGCGSIGLRHLQIVSALGADIYCISSQKQLPYLVFSDVHSVPMHVPYDCAIVATPTAVHCSHLLELSQLPINTILVEKPLLSSLKECEKLWSNVNTQNIYVAYNLRFHPAIQKMRTILAHEKILALQLHVGQYLPSWRPQQNYVQSYSAQKALGGGALRDLSHELDLACLLAGKWKRVAALGGKLSSLSIDSEDCVTLVAEHENCPQVSIHVDYLQTPARREIVAVLENGSIYFDLIQNTLTWNTEREAFTVQRNTTYEAQMKDVLFNAAQNCCTFNEGIEVVSYIDAIERAITLKEWIWNTL